jgi:lipopolysaccharide export LptBFGC system permease protein LptF
MKKLDRYVIREMIPPFVMGLLIVVVMFQINFYMALSKNDLTRNVPPLAIVKIIFLETPGFLNLTIPISVALGTSLALSRIARESELTALRSAGARIMRVIYPAALFGLAAAGFCYYVVDKVNPLASKKSYELQTSIGVLSSIGGFVTNKPLRIQNYTVSIGSIVNNNNVSMDMRDIILIERPEPNQMIVISSENGFYQQGVWRFKNAFTYTFRSGIESTTISKSKEFIINQKISIPSLMMPGDGKELESKELKQQIDELRKAGQDVRRQEIEYYNRFSVPSMCVIFAFVSPIFSIKFARQGGIIGVLVSMVLVLLYFNMWVIATQIIGKNPAVNPIFATWLPNIIFFVAGVLGLRSLE